MTKNLKGGRPTKIEKFLLAKRNELINKLRIEGYSDAQIARIIGVDQAQITRTNK